ncbi:unnamed protein product [Effrenium voratum]|nr:unnamed protein product [Effrenium voratum]
MCSRCGPVGGAHSRRQARRIPGVCNRERALPCQLQPCPRDIHSVRGRHIGDVDVKFHTLLRPGLGFAMGG